MHVSCSFCLIFHTLSWTVLKAEGDWKSVSSLGTLIFFKFIFLLSLGKYPMGLYQVGTWKSQSLLGCDPASCSFPSHKDLQLHNFMVTATKTAFSSLIPEQPFLICKDEVQKDVSSHLPRHQDGVKKLSLMHLESSQDPLYPVVLLFWQVIVVVKPCYEHFIILNY